VIEISCAFLYQPPDLFYEPAFYLATFIRNDDGSAVFTEPYPAIGGSVHLAYPNVAGFQVNLEVARIGIGGYAVFFNGTFSDPAPALPAGWMPAAMEIEIDFQPVGYLFPAAPALAASGLNAPFRNPVGQIPKEV
jgi:hypothetical protein